MQDFCTLLVTLLAKEMLLVTLLAKEISSVKFIRRVKQFTHDRKKAGGKKLGTLSQTPKGDER
jgi:hypothetical protein